MKTISLFVVFVLAAALPAYAQGTAGAGVSSQAGGAQVGLEVSAEARGEVNEDTEESSEKRADKATPKLMEANTKGTQDGDPDRPLIGGEAGNDDDSDSVMQNNESNLDFIHRSTISVQAVEVRGWDPKEKQEFLATVKTHAQVQSEQDLENFARGILLEDENVEELALNFGEVKVRYRVPAMFLGFIEASIPATVVAAKAEAEGEASGRVKVHFPWFRFLFSISEEVSDSTLESELSTQLAAELSAASEVDASANARLYQKITATLKVRHDIAMNAIRNMK